MKAYQLAVVAVLLVSTQTLVIAQLTCDRAIELHTYALQQLDECENPATQNTALCELIGEYEEQGGSGGGAAEQTDQLQLIGNPAVASGIGPWQNFLTQSTMTQFGDLGEIAYVLNQINATYSALNTSVTNEEYYAAWQEPWFDQAEYNAKLAADPSFDALTTAQLFFKASNYYFTGFWPYAFSELAIEAATESVKTFIAGANAHPHWTMTNFTVPFNNGTATAELPGYLITPNASAKLPLVIITGGTDFPKEVNVLQFGIPALERNYALLVYDGPGQGQVIRNPPYMPFYPEWEKVLAAVLDYVEDNFAEQVNLDQIIQEGVSLGGYLGGRACAGNTDRLLACVINPPILDVAPTYQQFSDGVADGIYSPLAYAGQQNAAALPNGYADAYQNGTEIINTLLLTCNASSAAPQLIAEAIGASGPIDPEIVYLVGGYGGIVSGDQDELLAGCWEAFRRVQDFDDYDVGNITIPVIGMKGVQDDLLGGQEDEWFALLSPSDDSKSQLVTFDAQTGGALHCQVGGQYIAAARQFAALKPLVTPTVAVANLG